MANVYDTGLLIPRPKDTNMQTRLSGILFNESIWPTFGVYIDVEIVSIPIMIYTKGGE